MTDTINDRGFPNGVKYMEDWMTKQRAFLTIACILIFAVSVQAEDIINTLAGYDEHSSWGVTGPDSTQPPTGKRIGDIDTAWWFRNNSTSHYLTTIELPLAEMFWLTGHIADIMIWSDTVVPVFEHVPGQMLESVTIDTVPIDIPVICTAIFSGTTILDPNTYYWVVVSVPGNEQVKWCQDEFSDAGRGAWRKDLGVWQAPLLGGHAGAMRVVGEPALECKVEFDDFARFAAHWLESDCNLDNSWCDGADLDQSGDVNEADLLLFADYWLSNCPYNWQLK